MDKRFSLVLDEQCREIMSLVAPQQRAEFVRNAIKHYSVCRDLEEKLKRLEAALQQIESGGISTQTESVKTDKHQQETIDETKEKLFANMDKFLDF